ncbi:MAG: transposase [Alphaproteobacteria bacterium]|nr:transposase [Alphaproteobacteria bacterium]
MERTMSAPDRKRLLVRDHGRLSIRRQCRLLGVVRSGVCRMPRPAAAADLALMRRLDELFTAWPFLGSRRMAALLRAEGCPVNRKRVQRLMRTMGIAALGPKPRATKPAPGHKIYLYLLRGLAIERSSDRTRCGPPTSPTCRSVAVFSTSWPSSTGRAARSCPGGSATPTRAASSLAPPSPARRHPHLDGWTTCSSSGCGSA